MALIDTIKKHRLLISWLSVLGSIAGLAFSAADVHSVLKERKAQKKLKSKAHPAVTS